MDADDPGDGDPVLEVDMACELHVVGQDAIVADHTVVCEMHADQEAIVRADAGHAPADLGAGMNGDLLAKDVPITDRQPRGLALVLDILRALADHRARKELVALATGGVAGDRHVVVQHAVVPQRDTGCDATVRADGHVRRELSLGIDMCGWVNHTRAHWIDSLPPSPPGPLPGVPIRFVRADRRPPS